MKSVASTLRNEMLRSFAILGKMKIIKVRAKAYLSVAPIRTLTYKGMDEILNTIGLPPKFFLNFFSSLIEGAIFVKTWHNLDDIDNFSRFLCPSLKFFPQFFLVHVGFFGIFDSHCVE
jgi:hypothetical protein